MAKYTSVTLSGSTAGRAIAIGSTGSLGTTIHTAATSTGVHDEVYLWATNISTADKELTIEWGGSSTLDQIRYTVPFRDGLHAILPGLRSEAGKVTRGFMSDSTLTSTVTVSGYVNRITP